MYGNYAGYKMVLFNVALVRQHLQLIRKVPKFIILEPLFYNYPVFMVQVLSINAWKN